MSAADPGLAPLVDTHAHLEEARLSRDLAGVLDRSRQAGVVQIVAIGTTADDSRVVAAMAGATPGVFAAVGVHPNHAAEARAGDWERIVEMVGLPNVVALGETGLDRYWDRAPFPLQEEWFDRHLALSKETGLPVVIHCRESERDIIAQLSRSNPPIHGVLHSFSGSWDDAAALLELGLFISFAGMLTFTNKSLDPLRGVAARLPLDRILVETDSPYLSPHPHRGAPNEPARVAITAAKLAEIRGLSPAELAQATTANARRLFNLPADNSNLL